MSLKEFLENNKGKYFIWVNVDSFLIFQMVDTGNNKFQWMESNKTDNSNEPKDLIDPELLMKASLFNSKDEASLVVEHGIQFPWKDRLVSLEELKQLSKEENVDYRIYAGKLPETEEELDNFTEDKLQFVPTKTL